GSVRLAGGEITDYHDAIIGSEWSGGIVDSILSYLSRESARCEEAIFENLRENSAFLEKRIGDGFSDCIETHNVCPVLPLEGEGTDFCNVRTVPASQQEKVRYYLRR